MLPTWKTRILAALENFESEVQLRLASEDGESVLREPYSPFLEADRVEEVDPACVDVAHELARRVASISIMPMTVFCREDGSEQSANRGHPDLPKGISCI